jgi:hypothetical protein
VQDFFGLIEEMRVWRVVRTPEQIRQGMIADDGRGAGADFNHPGIDKDHKGGKHTANGNSGSALLRIWVLWCLNCSERQTGMRTCVWPWVACAAVESDCKTTN